MQLTLPKWYDLHAHFRQGDIIPTLIKDHLAMGCAGMLAMPNTQPPVGKIFKNDDLPYWSIEEYRVMLIEAGADAFDNFITPLYLTQDTTTEMIEKGAEAGLLKACKYYPPHGTTGSEHGWHFSSFINSDIFKAMADNNVILCVHGEEHNMRPEDYFGRDVNAEEYFYRERMPRVLDQFPDLKIVGEHLTTKVGVDLILQAGDNITASITPQHLIYTVGDLLKGFKYHLYCMPLVKFEEDRNALRQAVTDPDNSKFFAGTDSAPHTTKATECGCAAGCYTGGIAPQLYAEAFELAGADLGTEEGGAAFKNFLCLNGPEFYNLSIPEESFTLSKEEQLVSVIQSPAGSITPLPVGMQNSTDAVHISWSINSSRPMGRTY